MASRDSLPHAQSAPPPAAQSTGVDSALADRIAALKVAQQRRAGSDAEAAEGAVAAASAADDVATPPTAVAAPPAEAMNAVQAAASEVSRITWPSAGSVAGSTGVVLATVFVSTLVILAVNAGLSSLSEALFD